MTLRRSPTDDRSSAAYAREAAAAVEEEELIIAKKPFKSAHVHTHTCTRSLTLALSLALHIAPSHSLDLSSPVLLFERMGRNCCALLPASEGDFWWPRKRERERETGIAKMRGG